MPYTYFKKIYLGDADNSEATNFVFGNCSNIILKNTVIGIAIINPGIPQMKPQNINITKS